MSDRVTVEISAGVADVRLNRPEKMNALDIAMFRALVDAGEALKADRSVRAVVLSGEGRCFCAGLDFSAFQDMAGSQDMAGGEGKGAPSDVPRLGDTGGRITHLAQQSAYTWQEVPVPVIAAVHGVAFGGGIQIALGADIRIVAPDAQLSVLEIRWGLVPDMTGTLMLPRLVGLDVAKELTFTGRVVSGDEAHRLGLATRVSPQPLEEAQALAAEIATKSPHAVRGAKELLNMADRNSIAAQFAEERRVIGRLVGSLNQAEAVAAYFEKRDPTFTDPS